jgi:dTMP kinase
MSPRGLLIVFEGLDRTGKSTQCTKLHEYLRRSGIPAEIWRFPDRSTPVGMMINDYLTSDTDLDDRCVHLLFSANRWEKNDLMKRKLDQGITIIADRYIYSGVAYSVAKRVRGMDRVWCSIPDTGLVQPDTVFYLETSPESLARRGKYGSERYEETEYQTRVLGEFQRMKTLPHWHTIDASESINVIHKKVRTILTREE